MNHPFSPVVNNTPLLTKFVDKIKIEKFIKIKSYYNVIIRYAEKFIMTQFTIYPTTEFLNKLKDKAQKEDRSINNYILVVLKKELESEVKDA